MINIDKALEVINLYYPLNLNYGSVQYKKSLPYKRLLKLRLSHKNNNEICNELYRNLCKVFEGYEVSNWTDLDSYNCYEFRILLHKNQPILDDDIKLIEELGGKRLDIHLFISILEKCYFYYINETTYDSITKKWSFRNIYEFNGLYDILKDMDYIFDLNGYEKISYEVVNTIVSNIETELIEKGKVKVFNCMFTELFDIKIVI